MVFIAARCLRNKKPAGFTQPAKSISRISKEPAIIGTANTESLVEWNNQRVFHGFIVQQVRVKDVRIG